MRISCAHLLGFILLEAFEANAATTLSACVTILRQIVEAMDPARSRILIDDAVVPSFLGPESLRIFNLLDMYMLGNLNGKERTEIQWRELFKATDKRLTIEKIWEEKNGGHQGGRVIEVRLTPTDLSGMNGLHPGVSDKAVGQTAITGVHQDLSEKLPEQHGVPGVYQEVLEKPMEQDTTNSKQSEPSPMEQHPK